MRLSAAQFTYQSLLPPAYELVHLIRSAGPNQGITDTRRYVCAADARSTTRSPTPNQVLSCSTPRSTFWSSARRAPRRHELHHPAHAACVAHRSAVQVVRRRGGVITRFGLYKPWFYRQAYNAVTGRTSVNC